MGNFLRFLVVLFFAGAVVWLGAQELHRKFGRGGGIGGPSAASVHQDEPVERASLKNSPARKQRDSLTRDDRKQLNQLLERIVP